MSNIFIERPELTIEIGSGDPTIVIERYDLELNIASGGLVPLYDDISLVAGANLSALRAVTTDGSGEAVYASNDTLANATVFGITATAASDGDNVAVRTSGTITDSSWNWTKGSVFLGTNGALTQTVPTGGAFIVHVGRALTATTLQIDIDTTIQTV